MLTSWCYNRRQLDLISIKTISELKKASSQQLCYNCGREFTAACPPTRDHVPPKAIFAESDRNHGVLILPAHEKCNGGQSADDQRIAQMLRVMHGKYEEPHKYLLSFATGVHRTTKQKVAGIGDIDLNAVFVRWIRAFHMALYGEFLPHHPSRVGPDEVFTQYAVHPPFPVGGIGDDGQVDFEAVPEIHAVYCRVISTSAAVGKVDEISAYGGKFRYRCCWVRLDNGAPACFWAMRVYTWEDLGDTGVEPPRACVGLYVPPTPVPPAATWGEQNSLPEFPVDDLDPFRYG